MLKGVVVQGLVWEAYEAILQPPDFSSKEVYHMTSDAKFQGSKPYDQ